VQQPALIVELQRAHRAPQEHYVFDHSPVRIGRGPRNELAIDHAFVSHCHGVLHFDAAGIEFVDLGSTNGSYLAGKRIESNQSTELRTGSTLTIGPLRLKVQLDFKEPRAELPRVRRTVLQQGPASALTSSSAAATDDGLAAVARRLAQAFLELSRGQRKWREELGLNTEARDGLHAIADADALVRYLLGSEQRLRELGTACEELMRNELALVQAIGAGARDLLDELSPQALAPSGLSGVVDWLARLLGNDARWAAFERQHRELQEETVRARIMMGRSFRRAYADSLAPPHARGETDPQP
jgi:predicted component of type VI protein secretion system